MTGSLRSDKGEFYAVLNLKDEYGRRKQKTINLHIDDVPGNKRKAEKAFRDVLADYESKRITVYKEDTLLCDFVNVWLENAKSNIELITYEGYKSYIDLHIYPYFKKTGVNLMNLSYSDVQGYYTFKSNSLSTNSLKRHHAVINQTLSKAVRDGLIAFNPATEVKFSRTEKFTGKFLTVEQGNKLLDTTKGTSLETAVILAMMYGLRRSEIAGLKWSAIDFKSDTLTVRHTVTYYKTTVAKDRTKNKSSCRVLPLNREVKEYLMQLYARQQQDKLLLGSSYKDTEYVCRWADGRAMTCDYFSKSFKKMLLKNGLPEIRLHDLRHSCASYMLKTGCSMKEISEWLGHSNIQTTMDVYAHLDFDAKKEVANKIGSMLTI